jgi:hypothetical protein
MNRSVNPLRTSRLQDLHIRINHDAGKLWSHDLGRPTRYGPGVTRVTDEGIYFSGAQKGFIKLNVLFRFEADVSEGEA